MTSIRGTEDARRKADPVVIHPSGLRIVAGRSGLAASRLSGNDVAAN
jgi:hypothetical protein